MRDEEGRKSFLTPREGPAGVRFPRCRALPDNVARACLWLSLPPPSGSRVSRSYNRVCSALPVKYQDVPDVHEESLKLDISILRLFLGEGASSLGTKARREEGKIGFRPSRGGGISVRGNHRRSSVEEVEASIAVCFDLDLGSSVA